MSAQTFILFANRGVWRIARADGAEKTALFDVPAAPDAAVDDLAEQAARSLASAGYRGEPVTLAIPCAWCLVGSISAEDLPRHDRRAMLFRLEEKLPLAAEEIVADFIPTSSGCLGVAVRIEQVRPVIDALEAREVAVESVVPSALLAAQELASPDELLLIREADDVSIITIRDRRPSAWSVSKATAADVDVHVAIAQANSECTSIRACGIASDLVANIAGVEIMIDSPADAAVRAAESAAMGHSRPWVELRRDAQAARDKLRAHRRPLNALLAAAAVLLLAITGTTLLRAAWYDRSIRQHDHQLTDLFAAEFPGWPAPANVGAVITSEHRKLLELHESATRQSSAESALSTLARVLGSLPNEVRFIAQRMSFDDRGFTIEGRIATPAELDAIASAIRSAGLRVSPPESRRDDAGGWGFTLRGETGAPLSLGPDAEAR